MDLGKVNRPIHPNLFSTNLLTGLILRRSPLADPAAIDGEGKNWEVYIAGFDPVGIALIPNSLRRVTRGPDNGSNPIKMSGGATFNNDDTQIICHEKPA